MISQKKLFVDKFQPMFFKDFEMDDDITEILNIMISINKLNILFVGDISSGKTSLLNALIREYYTGYNPKYP